MWKYIWRRNGRGGSCWWWWAMAAGDISSSLRNHTINSTDLNTHSFFLHDFHWNFEFIFFLAFQQFRGKNSNFRCFRIPPFSFEWVRGRFGYLMRTRNGRESFGFRLTAPESMRDDGRFPLYKGPLFLDSVVCVYYRYISLLFFLFRWQAKSPSKWWKTPSQLVTWASDAINSTRGVKRNFFLCVLSGY
jgi:hypothetical protein